MIKFEMVRPLNQTHINSFQVFTFMVPEDLPIPSQDSPHCIQSVNSIAFYSDTVLPAYDIFVFYHEAFTLYILAQELRYHKEMKLIS